MDSVLPAVGIGLAAIAVLWFVIDYILEPIFKPVCDWIDRRAHAKREQKLDAVAAALAQRPDALPAYRQLKADVEAVLRELGHKDVTFTFTA